MNGRKVVPVEVCVARWGRRGGKRQLEEEFDDVA